MIEKLQIKDFGTNENLDIELSPQVTTIIGKSFIGKSWILRALRWVSLNKPSGDSFINWDANKTKVRLSIDERDVIRIRSKSINSYRLKGKEKPYIAFGNDVPKDIAELLNLSDINFQSQHEAPFWFCETAGEVSRQLNSIVNLELIDRTHSNIASELRKTKLVIEITTEALSRATQQKKNLSYVKDLNQDLKNVEKLQNQYEEDIRKHSIIDEKVKYVSKYRVIQEKAVGQATEGLRVLHIGDRYRKTADSVESLSKLVKSAQNLQNILKTQPSSILPLEKLEKKVEQVTIQNDKLNVLIEGIEDWRKQKCLMEKVSRTLTKELEEIAGGRCPICGGPMKKS